MLGSRQGSLRAYNERIILDVLRRHGSLPKADIARTTNLSAQTISVIINQMLDDGLLIKGDKQKHRVGQPPVPIALNPHGAYSIGIKIGRTSLEILMIGLTGEILRRTIRTFVFPEPDFIFTEIEAHLADFKKALGDDRARLVGIGVAAPYGIGGWQEVLNAPKEVMDRWATTDIKRRVGRLVDLPITFTNDATAACIAELVFGRGMQFNSYLYYSVGAFIGGGVVLDGNLYWGVHGNGGALGSAPAGIRRTGHPAVQLLTVASRYRLEQQLGVAGIAPQAVLETTTDNPKACRIIDKWVGEAAKGIAFSVVCSLAVIDCDGVIIDGSLSPELIRTLAVRVDNQLDDMNLEGLIRPEIVPGSIGADARALGAAILPLYSAFAPDREVLLNTA